MKSIDSILQEFRGQVENFSFVEALREIRGRLGITQLHLSRLLNISHMRIKNLETGYFRLIPSDRELDVICHFYGLPKSIMKEKAEKHVAVRTEHLKNKPLKHRK